MKKVLKFGSIFQCMNKKKYKDWKIEKMIINKLYRF